MSEESVKLKVSGKIYELCPEDQCVIIDKKHYEKLKDQYIFWDPSGYATISIKNNTNNWSKIPLHIHILKNLEGISVHDDHIIHHVNALRFDDRMQNLKVVSYSFNNASANKKTENTTSVYKGVHKNKQQFLTCIRNNGKKVSLGSFINEIDAAKMYDSAYLLIYGTLEGSNSLLTHEEQDEIMNNKECYIKKNKLEKIFLPKYVQLTSEQKYKVRIVKNKLLGKTEAVFDTLEEANEFIKQKLNDTHNNSIPIDIKRNEENIPIIQVNNGRKNQILWALVDEDDYHKLINFTWVLSADGYAQSGQIHMHRYVMGCSPHDNKIVDHINHNRLDNRKSVNLRICTGSLNARNRTKNSGCTSQYIGVHLRKRGYRWIAQISINNKKIQLGTFDTEIEAHYAYEKAYNELVQNDKI